jgi:predicted DNA-binding WGR domain protein
MSRFYRLRFQAILCGGTALVREWGRIGVSDISLRVSGKMRPAQIIHAK